MNQNKKEYQKPVVEVLVVENNDIICSSTSPAEEPNSNFNGSSINNLKEGTI